MKLARSLFAAGVIAIGLTSQAHAVAVYGLTSTGSLVGFDSAAPGAIRTQAWSRA